MSGKASTLGKKTYNQRMEDFIHQQMLASGLYETYTYSFTSPKVFDKLRLPEGHELRNTVTISNPLGEDFSIMRTITIPDMLGVIETNYKRKVQEGRFFEISYVYNPLEGKLLPEEKKVLTLGLYGGADFYHLKGIVEQLFLQMNIHNADFTPEKNLPYFHPGKTAQILLGDKIAGYIGAIHPEVADNFDCPTNTYIAVLDVASVIEKADMVRQYKPLPKYPAVERDIAILVKDEIMARDIEKVLKKQGGNILEDIHIFDIYKGEQVPEGMKSMAYTLIFRAYDRTLVDEDVNKVMEKVLKELKNAFGATLRE
ncbi:MAG: hypothetical protein PHQ11_15170 [Paludibacter sp.]|nr:hypothetical protein [Paludibacter sp.]